MKTTVNVKKVYPLEGIVDKTRKYIMFKHLVDASKVR